MKPIQFSKTSEQAIELESTFGAQNYAPLSVVISSAKGIWVEDLEERKYMDFLSAYSAVNQGHCHPKIIKALINQAQRVTLTSRAFYKSKPQCKQTRFLESP